MVTKKKFDKEDPTTWGVENMIPEHVLGRMVGTAGFDVNDVRKTAKSHLRRIARDHMNKETYRELLQFKLDILSPDPADDNVGELGQILEYAFIVKDIEETLRNQKGSNMDVENLNESDAEEMAEFRASLRALKNKLLRKKKILSNGWNSQPETRSRIQVDRWEPDLLSQQMSKFHN